MSFEQNNLINRGIEHLRHGEVDHAAELFKRLQPPIPAIAAFNLAAFHTHKRRYHEALKILSQVDNSTQKKTPDQLRDMAVCKIFEEILQSINDNRTAMPSRQKKLRLMRLVTPYILTVLGLLDIFGDLANRLGLPNGYRVKKLVDSCRLQSWIYGCPVKPAFASDKLEVEKLKGYEFAVDVYHNVFLAYLDYWVSSQGCVKDLLLATVQLEDALALYCIICEKQPSVVVEVGSFIGFSSCIMAQALKDNGKGVIHCIDPYLDFLSVKNPSQHTCKMLKTLELDNHACVHTGFFSEPRENIGSKIEVLGRKISEMVGPIDLAFIDGDHATCAVLQDFMLLLPALSPHATVIFHDIGYWPSVRQAVVTIFQDTVYRQQMQYYEARPEGKDGLAIVEINKEIPLAKKDGYDKLTSV